MTSVGEGLSASRLAKWEIADTQGCKEEYMLDMRKK
jgi:hypothetical protein